MKVKDLIKTMQEFDSEAEVEVWNEYKDMFDPDFLAHEFLNEESNEKTVRLA